MMKTKTRFLSTARVAAIICALMLLAALAPILSGMSAVGAMAETAAMPQVNDGKEIDVWLIGGQSNAAGFSLVNTYPTDAAYAEDKALLPNGSENVWFYGKDDASADDPTDFVPVTFGLGQVSYRSGAEIGIATALNGSGRMSAVIKSAYCGTSIYPNTTSSASQNYGTWTPPSYIEAHGVSTEGNTSPRPSRLT